MVKKFKIVEKGRMGISLVSDDKDKKPLVLGFRKNAYLMVKLESKKVNDVVEIDVAVGTSGNYWAQDRTEVMSEMVKAKSIVLQEKNLNALIEGSL